MARAGRACCDQSREGRKVRLRPYQQQLVDAIKQAWAAGAHVVAAQLPTGGGKTVTFAHIVAEERAPCMVLAHRRELIVQMSVALAREGVRHRVYGPEALARLCTASHMEELGKNYIDPQAMCAVASVQTLAAWKGSTDFFKTVRLWVHDEYHHVLRDNLFGRVLAMLPNARGLGVTATPGRADGQGLGSHADGLADALVQGPDARWMIGQGYLSKYQIYAPPNNFNRAAIHITASGELNAAELRQETRRSGIMGDIVDHYVRHASSKLGLTFADSIENATTICEDFRAAGVAAEVLTGKTPDTLRTAILKRFKRREVMQIVSVALIDEGFDCPAVEVVSDGAATESRNRYLQRFGRGLRVLPGKEFMLYFDHVGNVAKHKLPDAPWAWSLDRRDRRKAAPGDVEPVTTCPKCTRVYERAYPACPYCKHEPQPIARRLPEQVDGDLALLDADALEALEGAVATRETLPSAWGLSEAAYAGQLGHWRNRKEAQRDLRAVMALWGGWRTQQGDTLTVSQRRWYLRYGVDVLSAQALGAREAADLAARVRLALQNEGITV